MVGASPLSEAGMVAVLVAAAAGARVDQADEVGKTPLWEASNCGHLGMLPLLSRHYKLLQKWSESRYLLDKKITLNIQKHKKN